MKTSDLKRLINNLPETPEIQGRQSFFNSAVIVPLIEIDAHLHLLFEKRAADIRQASEICFPGGKFDPKNDRSYQDTAVRETVEEIGIDPHSINVIGRLNTLITPMGVIVETFPAVLQSDSINKLNINKAEVDKVFTVPVAHFLESEPDFYYVRVEIQPTIIDQEGKTQVLFPTKELGLPPKYHQPWGGNKMRVLVYRTETETIWGITAEIVHNLINLIKK
jgi:8-oxo-dGTP pyrophosphatase MutT (NUDIX family)